MGDVRYGVLGPLEVRLGSRTLALGGPKQQVLLAVLLIHANQVVPVDRLINEVWPGRVPPSAAANVRTYVSGLRRVLAGGGRLISHHGGYQLKVKPGQLDLTMYESLIATATAARSGGNPEAEVAALGQATTLWRGTPLAGVPDSPDIATFRVYLEEQQAVLVEECGRALIELGRHGDAIASLRRHVAEHPLRERGHYLLVLALHASGATADALAAYRAARETFVRELGVEPGPELARLHRAVLNGDTPVEAGSPGQPQQMRIRPAQLPADTPIFVGRVADLAALDACLSTSNVPIVAAITGMPGAGKTALAVHWSHRVADHFPDGQLYVNLRGYSADPPLGPADILARFLRALGVPDQHLPHSLDERAALHRSLLAPRRVLILLDNAANADQVRPLLPGSGGSMVLVTSRSNLAGLVALDGAHKITLGPLPASDCLALLARVLGDRRVQAEQDVAAELVRLCGHLPLALRIAAADLAGHPFRPLAEAVAALSADRLSHLELPGDASAAVRASFDMSYRAQPPEARALFRLLGLVPGPDISTASAAVLMGMPAGETARMLAGLVAAHLVHQVASDRFTLHDLLRAYALERAEYDDDPGGREAALARLYQHYLAMVERAAQLLYPQVLRLPGPHPAIPGTEAFVRDTEALAWLDAERDNLVAAVQRCVAQGPHSVAIRLADGLRGYFAMRMRTVDWSIAAAAALKAAQVERDVAGEAATQLSLAWLNFRQGKNSAAFFHGRRALTCSQRAQWPTGEAAAHGLLGSAWMVAGQLTLAAEHSRSALALNRDLGNLGGQAVHLANLCAIQFYLGNLAESADYVAQAIDLHREAGSRAAEAAALIQLGQCQHALGDFQLAQECLTDALAVVRDLGDRMGEAEALQALAAVRRDSDETAEARELGLASLRLAREIGHLRLEAAALNTVGAIDRQLGRHQHASRAHREALRLARGASDRYSEVEALIGLAEAQRGLGQIERAVAFAVQALALARDAGFAVLQGHALTALAGIRLVAGDRDRALSDAEQAVAVYRRSAHHRGRASVVAVLEEAPRAADTAPR